MRLLLIALTEVGCAEVVYTILAAIVETPAPRMSLDRAVRSTASSAIRSLDWNAMVAAILSHKPVL
jgi:hypothetical protein